MAPRESAESDHDLTQSPAKRKDPPDAEDAPASNEEPSPKKAKPSSEAPYTPPSDLRLALSALVWEGKPMVWSAGGYESEKFGEYIRGTTHAGDLGPPVWSAERGCFVFKPRSPYSFVYKRERYCDLDEPDASFDEYCGIFGDADDVPPLIFVHRTANTAPWVGEVMDEAGKKHIVTSPPFAYWAHSEKAVPGASFRSHGSAPHVAICEPDLELHQCAKDSGDGAEIDAPSDKVDHTCGWSGNWTREFIRQDKQRKLLGALVKEVWATTFSEDRKKVKTVGMMVKLEPVPGSVVSERDWHDQGEGEGEEDEVEGDTDEDAESTRAGKLRLVSYKVRASVLEVYVQPEYLESGNF